MPAALKLEAEKYGEHPQLKESKEANKQESTAFIGRAMLNILDAPAGYSFHWGKWNERALQSGPVKQLVRAFERDGKQPAINPLMLAVEPEWLKEGTYRKRDADVNWTELPELAFVPQSIDTKSVRVVEFFSGQHRVAAARMWRGELEKRKQKIIKNKEKLEEAKEDQGAKWPEESEKSLEEVSMYLQVMDEKINDSGKWVVMLYRIGEWSILSMSKAKMKARRDVAQGTSLGALDGSCR